jgi:CMP-N,N'-diacetyllegionaminic acid synthase
MRILTIIPARMGSKGVPGKNIKPLGGIPLIAHTIIFAKNSNLSDIVISSESEDLINIAEQYGAEMPFLRPAELAQDHTPSIDVILHVVEQMKQLNRTFDFICLLQATVPFRNAELMNQCVQQIIDTNADSLVTVRQIPDKFNPFWSYLENENGFLQLAMNGHSVISQRQKLPPAYYRDGSVYMVNVDKLINDKTLYGDRLTFVVNNDEKYVNIDTLQDWEFAENLIKEL